MNQGTWITGLSPNRLFVNSQMWRKLVHIVFLVPLYYTGKNWFIQDINYRMVAIHKYHVPPSEVHYLMQKHASAHITTFTFPVLIFYVYGLQNQTWHHTTIHFFQLFSSISQWFLNLLPNQAVTIGYGSLGLVWQKIQEPLINRKVEDGTDFVYITQAWRIEW